MPRGRSVLLGRMRRGNRAYVAAGGAPTITGVDARAAGARPVLASVLTCSDIGAIPEQVLGLEPGDLYVIQTAECLSGQVQPEGASYFGPETRTGLVLVLGHTPCAVLDRCLENPGHRFGRISDELRHSRAAVLEFEPHATGSRIAEIHTLRVARMLDTGLMGSDLSVAAAFLDESTGAVRFLHAH